MSHLGVLVFPLDLFGLIFEHLRERDLIMVSRTCKPLHDFIMKRIKEWPAKTYWQKTIQEFENYFLIKILGVTATYSTSTIKQIVKLDEPFLVRARRLRSLAVSDIGGTWWPRNIDSREEAVTKWFNTRMNEFQCRIARMHLDYDGGFIFIKK